MDSPDPSITAAALEAAPLAILAVDREGAISMVNREAEYLFGYSRSQLLGKPVERLVPERFHGDHPRLRGDFFTAPESRRMGAGRDLYALRSDGTEFPVEIGLNPLRTDQGTFVLAAVVDITERKRLEGDLRQQAAQLERQTEELSRLNRALERSNLELQQFAYIASHDLQSPLRSVSGFVRLLQRTYEGRIDERADEWIDLAVKGVADMQRLIDDLLAYSRVDSRAQPFAPTAIADVVEHAVAQLGATIDEAAARVTTGDLPVVMGDRSQLVQLMQNLIGNAIKYNQQPVPTVHIDGTAHDGEWLLSIRDNGIGIEKRHQNRIFDVFQRLHTDREYPGTGIGLAVCRRVVQRHNGRIWLDSEPGAGSTFYVALPRTEGEE